MNRWLNYARTVARLRPLQIRYQLARRFLPSPNPRQDLDFGQVRDGLHVVEGLSPVQPKIGPDQIAFLNVARPFSLPDFDWRAPRMSKLWRYNLHYFDFLHWDAYDDGRKRWLVENWIAQNPPGAPDAWEPYPVSLRVVNWIRYCMTQPLGECAPSMSASLGKQLLWLEVNLEFHVLANHFLKNGKALLFGGIFFGGATADRLLQKGLEIMLEEADEQFLPDGGHFERSPQYHCICTEDYLDAIALLQANPGLATEPQLEVLRATARRALKFLQQIVGSDERIPLFNDCAYGIAQEPVRILEYGKRVLGENPAASQEGINRIDLPDTGYFGYRAGGDSLLIDCGPVGPDYQPGHAHCDTLSYELCINRQKIIVDSGVFEYAGGEMRSYVRSTAAHNTVRVNGQEQSEVWGEFRVARRAYPIFAEMSDWEDGRLRFHGAHDGYRRLPGRVVHERVFDADVAGSWRIEDLVIGKGHHEVQSFIHIHPEIDVRRQGDRDFQLVSGRRLLAVLKITSPCELSQETGWYCAEFGQRLQNPVIVLSATGELPVRLSYEIRKSGIAASQ